MGGASELANYGEYSGAPSEQQTYEYAKTLMGLMTEEVHPDGKYRGPSLKKDTLTKGHPSYKDTPTKGHPSFQAEFQMHWYTKILVNFPHQEKAFLL